MYLKLVSLKLQASTHREQVLVQVPLHPQVHRSQGAREQDASIWLERLSVPKRTNPPQQPKAQEWQ
jgi:hypothetical protein